MLKQYLSEGLLQIAIVLSLLRTDLLNFGGQNNEILNYPEVQDILQGQTVAYLPTSFHNQYNNLHNHGYAHPKHIEDNFYFSSLFHGVSTNINAFLVSSEIDGIPIAPQAASELHHEAVGQGETDSDGLVDVTLTASHSSNESQVVDSDHGAESDFNNPFPGLTLSKEDLDLIEVLWRQDVDLGVGKEVFDPNLRKELEHERELELRREQEKRQAIEKQERERQQQQHQWLTQNYVRDGETGEWTRIVDRGNNSNCSSCSPNFLASPVPEHTLEEALSFVEELEGNSSHVEQQAVTPSQSHNQTFLPTTGEFPCTASPPLDFTEPTNITVQNQTQKDRLEQSWQEVLLNLLSDDNEAFTSDADSNTVNANTTATTTNMPPVNSVVMGIMPNSANHNQSQFFMQQQQHQQLSATPVLPMPAWNQNTSASVSINETRNVLLQNMLSPEYDNSVLLQNVSMPSLSHDCLSGLPSMDNSSVDNVEKLTESLMATDFNNQSLLGMDLPSTDLLEMADIIDDDLPDSFASEGFLSDVLSMDTDWREGTGKDNSKSPGEASNDSAICCNGESPLQWQQLVNDSAGMFDGLEGATGGSDYDSSDYNHQSRAHSSSTEEDGYQYSCSSYGSPASVSTNSSMGSNDTEHSSGHSTALNHIHHNHTYHTQPGQTPREVKKYAKKDGPRQKGPHSRDAKRAEDLKLPFTYDFVVNCPVEEFNDLLTKTKLNEAQISLMRDMRRRGKNKVAAQNCRKRKIDQLSNLADDMGDLGKMRDKLLEERHQLDLEMRRAKEKHNAMYANIFQALRDEHGRPYDPEEYSLQQSSDGNVFLVRNSLGSSVSSQFKSSLPSSSNRGRDSHVHKGSPVQKKKSRE